MKEKKFLSPEKFIDIALRNNCKGTSISFNEPTLLFEYSLEAFRLAKKEGLEFVDGIEMPANNRILVWQKNEKNN